MANVVGVLLIVLILVGVPLKYLTHGRQPRSSTIGEWITHVPRRRARLALHDLPGDGVPALPQGPVDHRVHAGHAALRDRPAADLLGRAPGHRRGPRPARRRSRRRDPSGPEPCRWPSTAFVLGGGGLLGAVEVGMLRALFEADVRPDLILGTSVGALNGALVAADPTTRVIGRLLGLWESAATHPRGVRRRAGPPGHPGGAHRHPPALGQAAARTARPGARRPHLRRARGAVPVLRGPHRGRHRALVHPGPGHRRGDGVGRRPRPAAPGRGRRASTTSTAAS